MYSIEENIIPQKQLFSRITTNLDGFEISIWIFHSSNHINKNAVFDMGITAKLLGWLTKKEVGSLYNTVFIISSQTVL